jgi:hypothetical protein
MEKGLVLHGLHQVFRHEWIGQIITSDVGNEISYYTNSIYKLPKELYII